MNDGWCFFCDETNRLQEHHIVPRRFGGSDQEENIVELCPTCHDKLESLYDARFYDELDVEKPSRGQTNLGECGHEGCGAKADRRIGSGNQYIVTCSGHGLCDTRGCSERAKTLLTGGGQVRKYCGRCITCESSECKADAIGLAIYDWAEERPVKACEKHGGAPVVEQ